MFEKGSKDDFRNIVHQAVQCLSPQGCHPCHRCLYRRFQETSWRPASWRWLIPSWLIRSTPFWLIPNLQGDSAKSGLCLASSTLKPSRLEDVDWLSCKHFSTSFFLTLVDGRTAGVLMTWRLLTKSIRNVPLRCPLSPRVQTCPAAAPACPELRPAYGAIAARDNDDILLYWPAQPRPGDSFVCKISASAAEWQIQYGLQRNIVTSGCTQGISPF